MYISHLFRTIELGIKKNYCPTEISMQGDYRSNII